MAIAFRASGTSSISNDGGVTSYTITAGSGIVSGDFLLFIASADTDTGQTLLVGPPSASWTTCGTWYDASSSGGAVNFKTWQRWADGTDASASWTVSCSSGSANFAAVIAFTGVDTTNPISGAAWTGSNTLSTSAGPTPAITLTYANSFLVLGFGQKASSTPASTWTPPSGTTELIDLASGGTNYLDTEIDYVQLANIAGANSATYTAVSTGSKKWTGGGIALHPAAAAVAPVARRPLVVGQAVKRAALY